MTGKRPLWCTAAHYEGRMKLGVLAFYLPEEAVQAILPSCCAPSLSGPRNLIGKRHCVIFRSFPPRDVALPLSFISNGIFPPLQRCRGDKSRFLTRSSNGMTGGAAFEGSLGGMGPSLSREGGELGPSAITLYYHFIIGQTLFRDKLKYSPTTCVWLAAWNRHKAEMIPSYAGQLSKRTSKVSI